MATQEKRKYARINSLNLSYVCLDENNQVVKQGMGRSLNVSESGILLETHFPIDDQHTVTLTLGLEEDLVDIKGRPIHTRKNDAGKYEVGIEFLKSNEKTRRSLKKFIDSFKKKSK
ncbi:MAG: PilZ domain-containing protein [Deltaproteobacteria bacterium]|jgi:c-di-GMP-binding flagellar brake protein YcgR